MAAKTTYGVYSYVTRYAINKQYWPTGMGFHHLLSATLLVPKVFPANTAKQHDILLDAALS